MLSVYIYVCYLIIEEGLYILQGKAFNLTFKPAQFRCTCKLSPTPPTYTLYELSTKINFSLSIGVVFNGLLSFTSVNLIGFEFTFIAVIFRLAQPQVEPWTSRSFDL